VACFYVFLSWEDRRVYSLLLLNYDSETFDTEPSQMNLIVSRSHVYISRVQRSAGGGIQDVVRLQTANLHDLISLASRVAGGETSRQVTPGLGNAQ